MKRKILLSFLGIAVCGVFLNAQTLDGAILEAAIKISRELPSGASTAVINFRSDSENLNEYVIDELHGAILRNRSVIPVQPNQTQSQTIKNELNKANELNGESAKSIGKLLGVQYLITGSIERNNDLYNIVFNAINMDAEIKSQYKSSLNPREDSQFASLLGIKPQPSAASSSGKKPGTKGSEDSKLNTLGISIGTAPDFLDIICTLHGTFAPINNSFLELGVDAGFVVDKEWEHNAHIDIFSLYPFANYAFFLPFPRTKANKRTGGWYAGVGVGVMFTNYTFTDVGTIWDTCTAMNIFTGFNLGMFDISYTLRTDFNSFNGKLAIGYVYRFK